MIYRSPTLRLAKKQQSVIWRIFSGLFALIFFAGLSYSALIYWITSEPPTTVYLNIVEAWGRLGVFIFVGNLITIIIAGSIGAVIAIYINNKSAVPMYRLEEMCEQVGDGEFDALSVSNEKGNFRKLSIAFRVMVNKLYLRKHAQMECIDQINEQLQELRGGMNLTGMQRDVLSRLKNQLQELEKIL